MKETPFSMKRVVDAIQGSYIFEKKIGFSTRFTHFLSS